MILLAQLSRIIRPPAETLRWYFHFGEEINVAVYVIVVLLSASIVTCFVSEFKPLQLALHHGFRSKGNLAPLVPKGES